jgi:hypothetical protein
MQNSEASSRDNDRLDEPDRPTKGHANRTNDRQRRTSSELEGRRRKDGKEGAMSRGREGGNKGWRARRPGKEGIPSA